MEPYHWVMLALAVLGSVAANIIIPAVRITRAIHKSEAELRKCIMDRRDELRADINLLRRDTGETMMAIREKINKVELDASNTFMRRETFHTAMNSLHSQLQAGDKANEERSQRMEAKVERLVELFAGRK